MQDCKIWYEMVVDGVYPYLYLIIFLSCVVSSVPFGRLTYAAAGGGGWIKIQGVKLIIQIRLSSCIDSFAFF